MAFEPKKFNDIFEDMRGRTTALTDFEVGSVTRTMLESFSFEMGMLYQKMSLVYLSGFVDTATGSHLDNVVAVLGIQRGLPDFAVGKVTFIRDRGNAEVTIPVGTLVATEEKPNVPKKAYTTLDVLLLEKDQQEATVAVQALERGAEQNANSETITVMPRPIVGIKSVINTEGVKLIGRKRETDDELRRRAKNALLASGKATISALENAVLALPSVLDVKIIEEFNLALPSASDDKIIDEVNPNQIGQKDSKNLGFGMVRVVVDAVDYAKIRKTVEDTVERVRAAGVYAKIEEAKKITFNGVFRIEAVSAVNLTPEGHAKLEQQVKETIKDFLREIKMGDPLSISKLMKAILTVEGVDNLEHYILSPKRPKSVGIGLEDVKVIDNRIDAENLERFSEGDIFVASEDKVSMIDVQFKATGLTDAKIKKATNNLNTYLMGLKVGTAVTVDTIITKLSGTSSDDIDINSIEKAKLDIKIHSWTNPNSETQFTDSYSLQFVEKLRVDKLFGYNSLITIESALLLRVSDDVKATVSDNVKGVMKTFLAALPPETPIVLADLLEAIKKTTGVLDAEWSEEDFILKKEGVAAADRKVDNGKIAINAFEKVGLSDGFSITTDIKPVPVTVSLGIKILQPHTYKEETDKKIVNAALFESLTLFFAGLKNGQKLGFTALRDAIKRTEIGFSFKLEVLNVTINGVTAKLDEMKNFSFKISEKAVLNISETAESKTPSINISVETV
jgi:uncharacterized phage protein gp47/JayE